MIKRDISIFLVSLLLFVLFYFKCIFFFFLLSVNTWEFRVNLTCAQLSAMNEWTKKLRFYFLSHEIKNNGKTNIENWWRLNRNNKDNNKKTQIFFWPCAMNETKTKTKIIWNPKPKKDLKCNRRNILRGLKAIASDYRLGCCYFFFSSAPLECVEIYSRVASVYIYFFVCFFFRRKCLRSLLQ